jgi:hypothetical protein
MQNSDVQAAENAIDALRSGMRKFPDPLHARSPFGALAALTCSVQTLSLLMKAQLFGITTGGILDFPCFSLYIRQ